MAVQDAPPLSRFLRMAVVAGVESAVRVHIDRGDNLNARDDKGQTPLMLSAARNKASICKLLLDFGADADLLDPNGRSALSIAKAIGAIDAAATIEAACISKAHQGDFHNEPAIISHDEQLSQAANDSQTEPQANVGPVHAAEPAPAFVSVIVLDLGSDSAEFDLARWVAEEERPPPDADTTISVIAFEIQSVISEHTPIDTSADWDAFDDFLPERATPLPRSDDAEAREQLRLVLLRAIREGSIPATLIDDLSLGDDGEPNSQAVALLSMVINDLGAETDERFEYCSAHENFEVFVASEENPDEEDAIDDAVKFLDELAGRRNDPFRIYQREMQSEALLTAENEVALGQAMEQSIEKAFDALATWPRGIDTVLHAVNKVASGVKPLRWLSSRPSVEPHDDETITEAEPNIAFEPEADAISAEDKGDSDYDLDVKESIGEMEELRINADLLSSLTAVPSQDDPRWNACREAIASLGLTRSFLMELADSKLANESASGLAFDQAIKSYLCARNQMAAANLKLVYSIAKKYLFSGQPIDDLLQEGNIGLIKAVDRYDWRRGFKFSTYASWWIRQQVGRYIADKGKTIRLPVHVYEKTQRIAQAARDFELKHRQAPTVEEISELVGLPIKKVLALNSVAMDPLPIHEVKSLDEHIAVDVKNEYTSLDPLDIVEHLQLISTVNQLLDTIKPKEARILRMRFGIGTQESLTLEEVGVRLDLTRERIRQIEAKALRRLEHPTRLGRFMNAVYGATPPKHADAKEAASDPNDMADDYVQAVIDAASLRPSSATQVTTLPKQSNGSIPIALEKVLSQARAIGITVEIYQEEPDQRIWVHITETPDGNSRKIVRKLTEFGFDFWPGKGYWR